MDTIVPVIMCGGSGTRLWPASRESLSKQFIRLLGDLSTFQLAAKRVSDESVYDRPIVILHQDARFLAAEQLAEIGVTAELALEPERRDSAMAVACATLVAAAQRPEAVVLVMPADHSIPDDAAFRRACVTAAEAARAGKIMTLGVQPTHPATAFGYIKPGAPIGTSGAVEVESFIEKPDEPNARDFVEAGYLWNSGYFLFRADVMIEELEAYEPQLLAAARHAVQDGVRDLDFMRLDATAFQMAPKTSIDYAVMERTRHAGVLPVSFRWSDIGTWSALWDAMPRDDDGNLLRGDVVARGTKNSLVQSHGVLTAVVGLEDVVVVAQADAVLVTTRSRSGEVKELVADLRARNRGEADEHRRMYRPWGWYQRIDLGDRFQVKRIMVHPGGRLSLQKHHHRAEHWIVVKGTAEVTIDERVIALHENEGTYIPIGSVHRLHNPGRIDLEIIEVQVGSYTGEDDIIRLEDVYRR
jgi:mannose-1-phosphate guanylyltransferase/mannose-6-phosphate isomerase